MAWSDVVLGLSPWAWYRLGEASGAPQDSSGNARHGTTSGTKTYGRPSLIPSDATNNAQANTGNSRWISPAIPADLAVPGTGVSFAFTYKGTGARAGAATMLRWTGLVTLVAADPTAPTILSLTVNTVRIDTPILSSSLWDNAPHLIGITVEHGAQTVWVDGVKVGTGTASVSLDMTSGAELGAIGNSNYHNGDYDEWVVADRVWSDAEWEALYAGWSGTPLPAPEGTLAATLPMPTFTGTGTAPTPGTLAATLPVLTFAGTGTAPISGVLAATLPMPTVAISGSTPPSRAGYGLALGSVAELTVTPEIDTSGDPVTVPQHVIVVTVPTPTLVDGRPVAAAVFPSLAVFPSSDLYPEGE